MSPEELNAIKARHGVCIEAAAGHGKTEMIADLVSAAEGKVLLLTHTNAGVEALEKRLRKRDIESRKYSISTIAGFCIKWTSAYPNTAGLTDAVVGSNDYFNQLYQGTSSIFTHSWARDVLAGSYVSVIVDEYQDCLDIQHQIFVEINRSIPVIVMGDPLQAIFGWAGKLVSWDNMGFESVPVQTKPYRWLSTNPQLGSYLNDIREVLKPGLNGQRITVNTVSMPGCIQVLPVSSKLDNSLLGKIRNFETVVFILPDEQTQHYYTRKSGGVFQSDEPISAKELFCTASKFDDADGLVRVKALMDFMEVCSTGVKEALSSYRRNIEKDDFRFNRIKVRPEFGCLIRTVRERHSYIDLLHVLEWLDKQGDFKIHRKELFYEMQRALKYATDHNTTAYEAVQKIRMVPGLQKRYQGFRRLASRTVLSKGLEFDCVIVDLSRGMTVTDYYVALTRATKMVILLTDNKQITLAPPKRK